MTVHVYGVARADHPILPCAHAVSGPPGRVRTVREGQLVALVSDRPEETYEQGGQRSVHELVVTRASAGGAVLPFGYDDALRDEDAVHQDLADHAASYLAQLTELEGRVECRVRAAHRQDALLHQILVEDTEVHAASVANRAAGGGSGAERRRLGELVTQAVRARETQDARRVEDALAPYAERWREGPEDDRCLLDRYLLVRREETDGLRAAVDQLVRRNPQLDLALTGPRPPYDFVSR